MKTAFATIMLQFWAKLPDHSQDQTKTHSYSLSAAHPQPTSFRFMRFLFSTKQTKRKSQKKIKKKQTKKIIEKTGKTTNLTSTF